MRYLESSNPALTNDDAFAAFYGRSFETARPTTTTVQGVVNKTAILVAIAALAGTGGYALLASFPSMIRISSIAAFVLCLGFGWWLCRNPSMAKVVGPIYAAVEGVFLGALTGLADSLLASEGLAAAGGVGLQAFIITMACVVSILVLYRMGIVRPTRRFTAVIGTLTAGIMLTYLVSFVLSFFWQPLPLISFWSAATSTGTMALIGLGVNVFILVIASLFLVIDFGEVERAVASGAPKDMEWYLAFGLLITLAWIYLEAVKLVVRLYMIFGSRD